MGKPRKTEEEKKKNARIRSARYFKKYKERAHLSSKKYRDKNKKKIYDRFSKYQKDNRERYRIHCAIRRARKAKAGGSFTYPQWVELCNKYDNRCLCCGDQKKLTVDHVIPISKGGTNNIENIQPLCLSCNSSKGAKDADYRVKRIES
jgi:5-methylcytosine-specific restriction endonuclease McrA